MVAGRIGASAGDSTREPAALDQAWVGTRPQAGGAVPVLGGLGRRGRTGTPACVPSTDACRRLSPAMGTDTPCRAHQRGVSSSLSKKGQRNGSLKETENHDEG